MNHLAKHPRNPESLVRNAEPEIDLQDMLAPIPNEPGSDSLSQYLKGIRRTPLFSAQEEFEAATRARAGVGKCGQTWAKICRRSVPQGLIQQKQFHRGVGWLGRRVGI